MASFTRKMLKAMGIEEDKIDQIIEAHIDVVEPLKQERDRLSADAAKLVEVEKELEELRGADDYKAKYEAEHRAFEAYKAEQAEREQKAAKEAAARAYFESAGITGANLDIAMRGAKDEIKSLQLDGDKIKDNKALADLVSGTYAGLVVTQQKKGTNVANPPANNGGKSSKTKEEIYLIKDSAERQKAIMDNHELFGF